LENGRVGAQRRRSRGKKVYYPGKFKGVARPEGIETF